MQMKESVWNESFRPGIISSTKLYFQDLFVGAKRMSRKDFWWGALGISIIAYLLVAVLIWLMTKMPINDFYWSSIIGVAIAMTMSYYWIALFTAIIRRLHDRRLSGWLILLSLIPFGGLAVLILLCLPQKNAGNRWPKQL